MLSRELRELAEGPNFAAFTTLRPDGHPATQVMWVDCDDECLLINTEKHRRKYANVRNDPRVTVMLWDVTNPYRYVEARGLVKEIIHGPPAREHIDKLSWKYFDRPYDASIIVSERVILRITPLGSSAHQG